MKSFQTLFLRKIANNDRKKPKRKNIRVQHITTFTQSKAMPKTQKLKLHVMIESLDDHRRNKTFLTPIKIKIPDSHFLHDQTQSLIFSRHH